MRKAACLFLASIVATIAPPMRGNRRNPSRSSSLQAPAAHPDQMARMMQAAIQKNNLMKQPVVVTLKGGASGAEALIYMKSNPGRCEQGASSPIRSSTCCRCSAKIPFNWRELTPVR
jgi:tripartite-type tricarboxylate transporter receptor subunit TctC